MHPNDIEKNNLEAHVELCAIRYAGLEQRLGILETKLNKVYDEISQSKSSLAKTIITSTGLIISSVIGAIVTILIKF